MTEQIHPPLPSCEQIVRSPDHSRITELYERLPTNGIGLHATTSTRAQNISGEGLYSLLGTHFYCLTPISDWRLNAPPPLEWFESVLRELEGHAGYKKYQDRQPDAGRSVVAFKPHFTPISYSGGKLGEGKLIHTTYGLPIPKEQILGMISLDNPAGEGLKFDSFIRELLLILGKVR